MATAHDKIEHSSSVKDYLSSSYTRNPITRSIICKVDVGKELTPHDFDVAKRFLKDKSLIGFANYCETAVKLFQDKIHEENRGSAKRCIKSHTQDNLLKEASLLEDSNIMTMYNGKEMHSFNIHDFNLYAEYVNSIRR